MKIRFICGDIPKNPDFKPKENGWEQLKEPNIILTQLIALPIGILMFLAVNELLKLFTGYSGLIEYYNDFTYKSILLSCLILIPIHELLHAAVYPQGLKSDDTVIGFYPKGIAFYAYCSGNISRNNYLLSSLSPLIILSILPVFVMHFTGYNVFMLNISLLNAATACADVFGVFLILYQIPSRAILRNNGLKTYWIVGKGVQ